MQRASLEVAPRMVPPAVAQSRIRLPTRPQLVRFSTDLLTSGEGSWCSQPSSAAALVGFGCCHQLGYPVRGLQAPGRADSGVVAHEGGRIVAEALSDFVDAVSGVKQRRCDQVPDLVRA